MTQSPEKKETTFSSGTSIKKLFASAGYITLFDSDDCTFDLTTGKKYLRKTIRKREPQYRGLSQSEEHYIFVTDKAEREKIKKISSRWIPYNRGIQKYGFTVYEQRDISGYFTGYYKTVEKVINSDGKCTNWIRYFEKVGGYDEIQRK